MNFEGYLDLIFPNGLDIYEALDLVLTVGVYIIGIAAYAVFVFHFYRFISSRDMFTFDLSRYEESRYKAVRGILHFIMYVAKYIIVFPFLAFFWLAVLTVILAFLSKDRTLSDILVISLATVSTIRVAAYYHEDLSRDLAKILPFAVLGIFIIDASFFTIEDSLTVIHDANNHREIFYYFALLVALEFVLRILMGYVMLIITGRRRALGPRSEQTEKPEALAAKREAEGPWRRRNPHRSTCAPPAVKGGDKMYH